MKCDSASNSNVFPLWFVRNNFFTIGLVCCSLNYKGISFIFPHLLFNHLECFVWVLTIKRTFITWTGLNLHLSSVSKDCTASGGQLLLLHIHIKRRSFWILKACVYNVLIQNCYDQWMYKTNSLSVFLHLR